MIGREPPRVRSPRHPGLVSPGTAAARRVPDYCRRAKCQTRRDIGEACEQRLGLSTTQRLYLIRTRRTRESCALRSATGRSCTNG